MVSVKDYGAVGDGVADDTKAFQTALYAQGDCVYIPKGSYRICDTLRIPSNKTVIADSTSLIKCGDGCFKHENAYLLQNDDMEGGNRNIAVIGGIWDGNNVNNMCKTYKIGPQPGILFAFTNVDGLVLSDMVLQNSERFHVSINQVTHFSFTNIHFDDTQLRPCNDGINVGGFCEYGLIKGITARPGAPNDDLIALNADDNESCMTNHKKHGFIRNVDVEDVYAENAFTAIRIVSIWSEVSNIHFRNIECGVRQHGINLDNARYCADPIFTKEQYPEGIGNLHDVTFENVTLYKTAWTTRPICNFEVNAQNVVFKNFRFIDNQFHALNRPAFVFDNMCDTEVKVDGETKTFGPQESLSLYGTDFESIVINSAKLQP